eukprot:TRINITY_DN2299_c0_g1_i2.p1 TRINITY_DN2299_c0_g1~~TRINITY_DN2299_c0_g1_i2.p1  ORF type:complete len:413 (+),score=91.78 TRINITY_DN2299_c0_g1_i2:123-1361(+)
MEKAEWDETIQLLDSKPIRALLESVYGILNEQSVEIAALKRSREMALKNNEKLIQRIDYLENKLNKGGMENCKPKSSIEDAPQPANSFQKQFGQFQEQTKSFIAHCFQKNQSLCLKAIKDHQQEVESDISEKIDDFSHDINDNIEDVSVDIQKVSDVVDENEKSIKIIKATLYAKDLGNWYHHLKNVSDDGIASQGTMIQKAINDRIDETKFGMLVEIVKPGVLEWRDPSTDMNALEVSWNVKGSETLTKILVLRTSKQCVFESEKKLLEPYAEALQSDDQDDQVAMYSNALSKPETKYCLALLRSKLHFNVEVVMKEQSKLLGDWHEKLENKVWSDLESKLEFYHAAIIHRLSDTIIRIITKRLGENIADEYRKREFAKWSEQVEKVKYSPITTKAKFLFDARINGLPSHF